MLNYSLVVGSLRVVVLGVGLWTEVYLFHGLLSGSITYSVGEVDSTTISTSGFWDTLPVFLMFSPFGIGLILLGGFADLYQRYTWLWKALLGCCVVGYLWTDVIR